MSIEVVHTIADTRPAVAAARAAGQTIGLVPTMGALHEGHASLIRVAKHRCPFVVVSIFVNPAQFGPQEDLSRYPRTLSEDLALCEREGATLIFAPEPSEIYPEGFRTYVEVHELQDVLEGASRPGHFRGVATVVLKLFNILQPDRAYFGQKDAQQARIIRQMVRDLDVPVRVIVAPTVREPDGLALSSRNRYLEPVQRQEAVALSQALAAVQRRVAAGERDAVALRRVLADRIAAAPGAVLDYAEIVDADNLRPIERLERPALAVLAVRFGATRLIDNLPLSAPLE
ncbi:MAG TPA: pantoate--beta-alanine ligase [Gemmataceae bacterium]|nr:pantoate--beta-alanine ligase [Gemmataceae bacterium]